MTKDNNNGNNDSTQHYLDMISNGRWVEIERKDDRDPNAPKHIPDPVWEEIDNEGHIHRYVVTYGILTIPTLVFVEAMGCFVCKECGQKIEPGRITVYSKGSGWLVNGKVVGEEVAVAVRERLGRE
jgi:hypothetical protein